MTPSDQNPYTPPMAEDLELLPSPPPHAVTPAEGPSGFGGWLIFPLLGVVVRPLILLTELLSTYVSLFKNGSWANVTTSSSAAYHPLWAPMLISEIAFNILILGFCLYLAFHFFKKSAKAPKLYIALFVTIPIFMILNQTMCGMIPNFPRDVFEKNFLEIAKAVISACVWIPYFLQSVRVQNTFTT